MEDNDNEATQLDRSLSEFFAEAQSRLGPSGTDLDRRRQRYERLGELAGLPADSGVQRSDLVLTGRGGHAIALRRYQPAGVKPEGPNALGLYLHGGGWNAGNIASHDPLVAWLSCELGVELISVQYRLSPEHPHPAALDDVSDVLNWAAAQGRPLLVLGDSAGAHLAAAATLGGVHDDVIGVGLLYPPVSPNVVVPSHQEHAHSPGLSKRGLEQFWDCLGGAEASANTRFGYDLLKIPTWRGFPPTVILSAQIDPLRDEARLLADKLQLDGVTLTYRCAPSMPHGFARFIQKSALAMTEMRWFAGQLQKLVLKTY